MTEVAFYHLTRSTLSQALPKLLEKTLEAGKRALVLAATDERVEGLAADLWTYDKPSWLAHGTLKDGRPEDQPVWLDVSDVNANAAQFLFLTDGAETDTVGDYERCFELFDGRDEVRVQAARGRWKAYKDQGFDLTYWQQTESGGWQKKDT